MQGEKTDALFFALRDDKLELGESRHIAMRRLKSTERKIARDERLNDRYHEFIKEYEDLYHMSLVTDTSKENTFSNYLPHHEKRAVQPSCEWYLTPPVKRILENL